MKILGLYAHLNLVHIYMRDGNQVFYEEKYTFEERALSLQLPILLKQIVQDDQIDCIALQNGPGAFTSLRVTLAFAQGLCTGWGIPIYACSHFDLLKNAYNIQNGTIAIQNKAALLPAVDVKNGVFGCPMQLPSKDTEVSLIRPNESDAVNLGKILYDMAIQNKSDWIEAIQLSPNYCFLPTYKKAQ